MDKEKFDLERWAIAENLSKNFHINGEGWDASDFEWASHCLQMDGYRKSSDVAREIFEEIETSLVIGGFVNGEKYLAIREDDYNHYKKKYTKSEDTNES